MTNSSDLIQDLIGETLVIDLAPPFVYIGRLAGMDQRYLILEDADAHDLRDSSSTRELYVLDSKRLGIGVNRKRVYVQRDQVVGISKFADVQE